MNMNVKSQRLCVWCGPIMIAVWALSFTFLCRMIPPPAPSDSAAKVVAHFANHTVEMQIGLVISLFACALLVPFGAAISAQMRRIEGGRSVLAEAQLVSCGLLCVEFLVPFMMWQTICYRVHEWSPHMVQMLNDLAWLMFLGIICNACVQVAAAGVAILRDRREQPIFPRWLGWYNVWTAFMWIPAGCIPLFKTGPFCWDGLFAWWVPLTVYFVWFVFMTVYLLRAIRQDEEAEAAAGFDPDGGTVPFPPGLVSANGSAPAPNGSTPVPNGSAPTPVGATSASATAAAGVAEQG